MPVWYPHALYVATSDASVIPSCTSLYQWSQCDTLYQWCPHALTSDTLMHLPVICTIPCSDAIATSDASVISQCHAICTIATTVMPCSVIPWHYTSDILMHLPVIRTLMHYIPCSDAIPVVPVWYCMTLLVAIVHEGTTLASTVSHWHH